MGDGMRSDQVSARDAQMASLYEMAVALSSAVDLNHMLAVVLEQVRSVLHYDACLIMLATADGRALRIEAADGDGVEGLIGLEPSLEQGINAWIYRECRPALVHDADTDPRRLHITGSTDSIRAAVGAPLVADGKVIGTVYATRREPNSFRPEHLDFLTITASQVASAVQRTYLLDRAYRRAEELETLLSIAMVMASTLDVEEILQVIYEQAGRAMDTSAFFVALFDKGTGELSFKLMYDQGERLEPFVVRLSETPGLTGYVIQTGQPLLIRNLEVERANLPIEPVLIGEPTPSWLGVPIAVRGQVLGAIGAQSYEAYAFTSRHERLLSGIASQAGISLQNARLMSELKLVNADLEEMVKTQAYLLHHIGDMAAQRGDGEPVPAQAGYPIEVGERGHDE